MPTKSFVLSKIKYMYNDEIYTCCEFGSGIPIKVYSNEIKVKTEANRCNLEFLRNYYNQNFNEYCYELNEIFNAEKLNKFFPKFNFFKRKSLEEIEWLEIFKAIEEVSNPIEQYNIINNVFTSIDVEVFEVEIED